ncbi:hypothetical protein [Micromonospora sp. NPDC048169]
MNTTLYSTLLGDVVSIGSRESTLCDQPILGFQLHTTRPLLIPYQLLE